MAPNADDSRTTADDPSNPEDEDPSQTVDDGLSEPGADDPSQSVEEGPSEPEADGTGPAEGPGGRREVLVPLELYKVVTVFSTLIAVGLVVLGFVLLDTGTTMLGRAPAAGESGLVGGLVALAGVGVIVGGAAVYVYASRFRTRGMGKSKDDAGESPE